MNQRHIIHQLRELRRRTEFTATRVGAPGCAVRLEAQADLEALDVALFFVEHAPPEAIEQVAAMTRPARS